MLEKYKNKIIYLILVFLCMFIFFLITPYLKIIIKEIYEIIKPFLIALAIAFATHGLVDKIEKAKVKRSIAVFIVVFGILYLFILLVMNIVPIFFLQLEEFIQILPDFIESANEILFNLFEKIKIFTKNEFNENIISDYIKNKMVVFDDISIDNLFSFIKSISNLVFIPMITVYLLYDYNNIRNYIKTKTENKPRLKNILKEIEIQNSRYLKGLFLVIVLLSLGAIIGFLIIDLDYAVFLGFIIGITNVIPIIGQYIGGIFVALFALSNSSELMIKTIIVILSLQLLESNFLTPYIQSKATKINPLWILLGFITFSKWFGFIGCLLSVPIVASIKIVLSNIKTKKL